MKTKAIWGWILLSLGSAAFADSPSPLRSPDFYYYFTVRNLTKFPDYVFVAYPFSEIGGKGYKILETANRLRVKDVLPSFYAISAMDFDKKAADADPSAYFARQSRMIRAEFGLSPETAYSETSRRKADSVTEIIEIVSVSGNKAELRLKDRLYGTKQKYMPFFVLAMIAGVAIWMIAAYVNSRKKRKTGLRNGE